MPTFADDIETAVGAERIVAILVRDPRREDVRRRETAPVRYGVALSWDEAKPALEYDFDRDSDGQEYHGIYVWTATRMFYAGALDDE